MKSKLEAVAADLQSHEEAEEVEDEYMKRKRKRKRKQ